MKKYGTKEIGRRAQETKFVNHMVDFRFKIGYYLNLTVLFISRFTDREIKLYRQVL